MKPTRKTDAELGEDQVTLAGQVSKIYFPIQSYHHPALLEGSRYNRNHTQVDMAQETR